MICLYFIVLYITILFRACIIIFIINLCVDVNYCITSIENEMCIRKADCKLVLSHCAHDVVAALNLRH